ncbi:Alpha/Beta hydrolase protein [Aspergillus germanicus]
MSPQIPSPPLNPDLASAHKTTPFLDIHTPEKLHSYRETVHPFGPHARHDPRPKNPTLTAPQTPGVLHIHGGGLATGTRFLGYTFNDWIEELGAVIVTAEYRLAPDYPAPAGLEDSYAALVWMAEHAEDLRFNPSKLIVGGGSAGGNIAAGLALLARDRNGPHLAGQVLMYPWVSDSMSWPSIEQYGDIREHADMYTAPLRAESLAGVPPTVFRCLRGGCFPRPGCGVCGEVVGRLWAGGVSTKFPVWPGNWHGFDVFVPGAEVSRRAVRARLEWLRKLVNE